MSGALGRRPPTVHIVALLGRYGAGRLMPRPSRLAIDVDVSAVTAALRRVEGDPHVVVFASVIDEARRWLDTPANDPTAS